MKTTIPCGYYELPADEVFNQSGGDCAAWYVNVLVKAGRYPVFASTTPEGVVNAFHVKLTGTIVSDNFQALYCGVAIGAPYDTKQNAGKPADAHLRVYSYSVLEKKEESRWNIDVAALPNIGRCYQCGNNICGGNTYLPCLCISCVLIQDKSNETVSAERFPRIIKALDSGRYGSIACKSISQAVFGRSEWHREQILATLQLIRKARRQFGYPETNYFRVGEDGSVTADGRWLGRVA